MEESHKNTWLRDTGGDNMWEAKEMFYELDESITSKINNGNNITMSIMGMQDSHQTERSIKK